jgi:hypothetical protein
MGTQSNDRGGENRQSQQPGRTDKQGESQKQGQAGPEDRSRQAQDQGDPQRRNVASDDDVGGDVDADGEVTPPQSGNQDRERTGQTGPRNP